MPPESLSIFDGVPRETLEKLNIYHGLLLKWQRAVNLVGPATIDKAWERHFLDSAQIKSHLPARAKVLTDIGSGAGFPGLVLAILCPDIHVNLIESDQRKCEFLRTVSRETLAKVTILSDRIEALSDLPAPDVLTARALASLQDLCAYACPWAEQNPHITLILHKGREAQKEAEKARETFDFKVDFYPSQVEGDSFILVLKNLTKILRQTS